MADRPFSRLVTLAVVPNGRVLLVALSEVGSKPAPARHLPALEAHRVKRGVPDLLAAGVVDRRAAPPGSYRWQAVERPCHLQDLRPIRRYRAARREARAP